MSTMHVLDRRGRRALLAALIVAGLLAPAGLGAAAQPAASRVDPAGAQAIDQPGPLPALPRQETAWRLARDLVVLEREV